jgi:carboxylate-amine ligase
LRADLGHAVRRLLICGRHVHVGIEDDDLRIDLMNQATYFLPHLLALSTSSPFWEGEDTGPASYSLTVFDALPRTGLPDRLSPHSECRRLVDHFVQAGCIEGATRIWWDIRPSDKVPTLEQRVTEVCSRRRRRRALPLHPEPSLAPEGPQPALAHLSRHPGDGEPLARPTRWRGGRSG